MKTTEYNKDFYQTQQDGSYTSASEIIPILVRLVNPGSVLDIGCGVGTWLRACKNQGIRDVLGIDGDYVDASLLQVEKNEFIPSDINQPLKLDRRFDLGISLEVGEHVATEKSETLVASLVRHADVVLFSAAIPHQRGTTHINEQWPEFWAALFQKHDYVVIDCVRDQVWNNPKVEYFYAQNSFLYVNRQKLSEYPTLKPYLEMNKNCALARVHPTKWLEAHDPKSSGLRKVAQEIPYAVSNSLRQFVTRIKGRKGN